MLEETQKKYGERNMGFNHGSPKALNQGISVGRFSFF
jgi:hypothetical protein